MLADLAAATVRTPTWPPPPSRCGGSVRRCPTRPDDGDRASNRPAHHPTASPCQPHLDRAAGRDRRAHPTRHRRRAAHPPSPVPVTVAVVSGPLAGEPAERSRAHWQRSLRSQPTWRHLVGSTAQRTARQRLTNPRPGPLPRRFTSPSGTSGLCVSCDLGVLVSARGLLYQSKPSIEAPHVNTLGGACNPNSPRLGKCVGAPAQRSYRDPDARFRTYPSLRSNRDPTPHYPLRNSP